MKKAKLKSVLPLLFICYFFLSNGIYSQPKPLVTSKCVIGNFTVFVPNGWDSFSNEDKASARDGFASDLEPGLGQYSKPGNPAPKMGDFEIFQKPTDGQLIGWTLIVPDQNDFLKEILKKEENQLEQRKSQIKSGTCRLVKINGIDVVRVDIEMANGVITTNLHFWSPKSPGIISTLMISLRPNKSALTIKEYENIISSLKISEVIKK